MKGFWVRSVNLFARNPPNQTIFAPVFFGLLRMCKPSRVLAMCVRNAIRSFCADDSGAVSVDWTVLTAAMVGLGMAGSAAIVVGTGDLSHEIANQTSGQSITTTFNSNFQNISFFDDFENGNAQGWSVGQTDDTEIAFGGILGRFGGTGGGQMVHKTWDIDPDAGFAVLEFDVHAIDTWDLEMLSIFLNDDLTSQRSFSTHQGHAELQRELSVDNPNIKISYTTPVGIEHGFWERGDISSHDETVSVRIEVTDPGSSVKLGFGSTLNQSVDDESWAVDNVRVTATNDPESV